MNHSIGIENIKYYLRALYQDGNRKEEAEQFFMNMINSENQCSLLFSLLIDIIIQDDDANLKNISTIIIRQMNFDFIFNTILILNQRLDPNFYKTIEILTDYLAVKNSVEIFPLINQYISVPQDLLTQKALVQLLSSISYYIEIQKIKINIGPIWKDYYKYFMQTVIDIISKQILDENEMVFLYYFIISFQKNITSAIDTTFFHDFTCFCLQQKCVTEIFKMLIENVLTIYSKLLYYCGKMMPIVQFFKYFDEFCQSTHFIPESSLKVWQFFFGQINAFDPLPENLYDLILNYVFPFIKFQPQLIDESPDEFLDKFSPDFDDSPLKALFIGLKSAPRFPPLSDFVFQFANNYFGQYIEKDIFEVCRLLIFVSRFLYNNCAENQHYICLFYQNNIHPLIANIVNGTNPDPYLSIAICEFIRTVNSSNDSPIFNDNNSLQILIIFLRMSVLVQFNEDNKNKMLFYFAIRAIISKFKNDIIQLFNFSEKDIYEIFMKVFHLNTEIQTDSMNDLMKFIIENMMPTGLSIHNFVKTLLNFCFSVKYDVKPFLLNKYINLLQSVFSNCQRIEDKQIIFQEIYDLLISEMSESRECLIINCYESILSTMIIFTEELLDDYEKMPFFMNTTGQLISSMLFSINLDVFPCSDYDILDFVTLYMKFGLFIIQYTNDPIICLELFIKPFLIPIIMKLDEIILYVEEEFSFECAYSPLIKFKGNDSIFQCMWEFNSIFQELKSVSLETKNDFLTSLIISKPSMLFEFYNQELFSNIVNNVFVKSTTFVHICAINEILIYLLKINASIDIVNIFANSFSDRVQSDNIFEDGSLTYKLDDQLLLDHNIFTEGLEHIFANISVILSQFGIVIK